jgi:hypothetical protein
MELEVQKFCPLRKKKKSGETLLKKERKKERKGNRKRSKLCRFTQKKENWF